MPNLAFFEPIACFTLLNAAMRVGFYVTALSGQLSMATAAVAGVGGYASGILTVKFGVPFVPAVAGGALLGGLLGCVLALLTLKMRDFILKLTTLAAGEALSVLAFNLGHIGGGGKRPTGAAPHSPLPRLVRGAASRLALRC